MSFTKRSCTIFSIVSLSWTIAVSASTFVVTNDELDPTIFPDVAESIRTNLEGPDAPQGLTSARKQEALESLARIEDFLSEDSEGNVRKIQNEQTRLNAALASRVAKNDSGSEVVCVHVKKTGSNIPRTECRTRAEMDAQRMADEEARRMRNSPSMDPCPASDPRC